jgi:hypothetical protein
MSVAATELSMPIPLRIAHPIASKLDSSKIAMELAIIADSEQ